MVAVTRLVRLVITFIGSGKDNEPQLANDGFSFLFEWQCKDPVSAAASLILAP